ncbi:uncharacterized protein LOC8274122 [Ricinus communis]|uniref:Uncharacterized protein n=1 Tax=Ricinus communis TaxID=3988 RepID=B9RJ90_RICCO|nr:uncharacterized protein LOC8274122 [Ricinus communis]EEF48392.1 conserved hypothetical protein [Ricinus communis]|eukprot:XP_002513809.1 uncharacterized protein LOC8274122 [Ricinus communis]
MNGYREDNSCCYFHPKDAVIGVCAVCLNERLLVLAAKQSSRTTATLRTQDVSPKKPPISLPKIFTLSSLLNRLEFRHWKLSDDNNSDVSTSPEEDSFISIKFEDNGAASWEKSNTVSKVCLEKQCSKSWINQNQMSKEEAKQDINKDMTKETMSVIEHARPRAALRWRKRIGHLFQVIKLKRSNKGNMCHVGTKVEGVKVMRKGWIRSLTKRRTKE